MPVGDAAAGEQEYALPVFGLDIFGVLLCFDLFLLGSREGVENSSHGAGRRVELYLSDHPRLAAAEESSDIRFVRA